MSFLRICLKFKTKYKCIKYSDKYTHYRNSSKLFHSKSNKLWVKFKITSSKNLTYEK